MPKILKLNEISSVAYDALNSNYSLEKNCDNPDGIMLRSFNMHDYDIPQSVLCVGRAGAGVNNIPIDKCSEKGIVVFNTPGANANAVKELVICSLFLAGRKIIDGIKWTSSIKGKGEEVAKLVESGKKAFVGKEIRGKKLGVIGLGAIGVLVANTAYGLGMDVIGYDPYISVDGAWSLDKHVKKETDINAVFANCDYITVHVPLNDSTRGLINGAAIAKMKTGVNILNFSRGALVDSKAIIEAVEDKKVNRYITDFPTDEMIDVENIITIPHLGASTPEAEDNCAYMAAAQMVDFFENGNITNSVNLPKCVMDRQGAARITVFHKNAKNVINSITAILSEAGINICNIMSQSKGDYAYLILDADEKISDDIINKITALDNIIRVRSL